MSKINLISIVLFVSVAACGAGSGGGEVLQLPEGATDGGDDEQAPPTENSNYQRLDGTAEAISSLTGSGYRDEVGNISVPIEVVGQLAHGQRDIQLSDGTVQIDARFISGQLFQYDDGSYRLQNDSGSSLTDDIDADFNYLTLFKISRNPSDPSAVPGESFGVYGIATRVEDIPVSGDVRLEGFANVAVNSANNGTNFSSLGSGRASIDINYALGSIDVDINDFQRVNLFGDITEAPIDTVELRGMQIEGNAFGGGSLVTLKDGQIVDVIGPNVSNSSTGHFYGLDSQTGLPAEVGGTFVSVDGTAFVRGVFIGK